MRVIAGIYGGRLLAEPKGFATHPMSERIKGALFNSLQDLSGIQLLDAFGGSAALAIEAISRGADAAVVCEYDYKAYQVAKENIETLGIDQISLHRMNVSTWSKQNQDVTFPLVICDPPFNDIHMGLIERLVNHVSLDGLLVFSHPSTLEDLELSGAELLSTSVYGNAALTYYRKTANN